MGNAKGGVFSTELQSSQAVPDSMDRIGGKITLAVFISAVVLKLHFTLTPEQDDRRPY
jgi:hypothetical protein